MPTTANPNMAYYLTTWREMLSTLLGWSNERVSQWAEQSGMLEYMTDPDDIFYHETPQYWIMELLVPADLRRRLPTADVQALQSRILAAFEDEHRYEFPVGTDWRPFRTKVDRILGEYGTSLARSGVSDAAHAEHRG